MNEYLRSKTKSAFQRTLDQSISLLPPQDHPYVPFTILSRSLMRPLLPRPAWQRPAGGLGYHMLGGFVIGRRNVLLARFLELHLKLIKRCLQIHGSSVCKPEWIDQHWSNTGWYTTAVIWLM